MGLPHRKRAWSGGFDAVFLLTNEKGHTVAIKIAILSLDDEPRFGDPKARQKFLREIEIAKAVHHPNVVTYGHSGSADEGLFFTMEYCAGGSVGHLVEGQGKLLADRAVNIVGQALDGLHHMHTLDTKVTLADGETVAARGLVLGI